MQWERKSEIQDGVLWTGNTYITACIQRSCTIPTAMPIFFKFEEPNKAIPYSMRCKLSQKSKMAAHKHECFLWVSRHLRFLVRIAKDSMVCHGDVIASRHDVTDSRTYYLETIPRYSANLNTWETNITLLKSVEPSRRYHGMSWWRHGVTSWRHGDNCDS